MKLARVEYAGAVHLALAGTDPETLDLIQSPAGVDPVGALIEQLLAGGEPLRTGQQAARAAVRFLSPISQPRKNVLCIGKNYAAHAAEFTKSGYDAAGNAPKDVIPEYPIVFTKAPTCLNGAEDDIEVPWQITQEVDYEAELGVVIGRGGRNIRREDAWQHVFGYTVINDVTARDLQIRHKQWLLGKSIDTFCPCGPWIVTRDEVDASNLQVRCWVNDELRQDANTRDLIFDIPTIIETISASMTLLPGDLIATGTPAGVGVGFTPPKFLKAGDVVRVEIDGVGILRNTIR